MTERINSTEALELLTRVVKREGRDTKRPCHYVVAITDDEDKTTYIPFCIIACVFAEIGVSTERMLTFGWRTIWDLWEEDALDDIVDMSPNAAGILMHAQRVQDAGNSWGQALARARRHAWVLGAIGKNNPPPPRFP